MVSTHAPPELERTARRLLEAFNSRDLELVLSLVHAEIVFWSASAALTGDGEPYRGHDGIRSYLADIEADWEELVVDPVQVRAAGRAVVALGQTTGRGKAASFERLPTKWVLKFKDGLVISAQVFADESSVTNASGASL